MIGKELDIKTVEQIDREVQRCVESSNIIENGNYILAMLLKDIKDGKVRTMEEVVKWCFDMIKTGRLVASVRKDENHG